ncbi:MAG: TIGR04086 family membrane protein [Clostridia bacterium]|nr:TIGR04086 family membrane protein [Clostridia bacterium]
MATAKRKKRTKTARRAIVRGAALGAGVLVLSVLLLTLFVFMEWLPESAIPIGNTVIKILTALAAGVFTGFGREKAPWYFGGIAAILSLAASIALMSVYLGSFSPSWNLLADLLMGFAIGSAAAAVLSKRKTE